MSRATTLAELAATCDCADADLDIAEAALLLAALDRPQVPLERYRVALGELVEATATAAGASPSLAEAASALGRVIAEAHGYRGDQDTYDDPQNANLMRVIDRRKGLPVALGVIYLHTAGKLGWPAHGLSFPGHFLIRLEGAREAAILDPFNRGIALDAGALRERVKQVAGRDAELSPQYFQPVSHRAVLLRLQNNLKSRALSAGRFERAAEVLESMVTLAPREAWSWREFGTTLARTGALNAALSALATAGDLTSDADGRAEIDKLIRQVRAQLN